MGWQADELVSWWALELSSCRVVELSSYALCKQKKDNFHFEQNKAQSSATCANCHVGVNMPQTASLSTINNY